VKAMNEIRQCTRCVLDTTVSDIVFDENGVCNYCHEYDKLMAKKNVEDSGRILERLICEIKQKGKNREYDCILGLSGGVDSSYLAVLAVKNGLRPLVVHVDTGWNSEIAVKNIENIIKKFNLDLYTVVIDWEEMRDLQLSFFKASVPDCDIPQDHVFPAILHKLAKKFKIKSILSGHNDVTEFIYPRRWGYDSNDLVHILNIHKKHGSKKLRRYPQYSFFQSIFDFHILGIRNYRLLNYTDYNKAEVKRYIIKELGWTDYGGKHYESRFTKFFQAYYLPTKFGIDKRKMHLSNLIVSNQITRDEALLELSKPLFDNIELEEEIDYVTRKLGISKDDWQNIMNLPLKGHDSFRKNSNTVFYKVYEFIKRNV
jgi:N-acetyl sugar amidotransferase